MKIKIQYLKFAFWAALVALTVAACGGGGGCASSANCATTTTGTETPSTPTTAASASIANFTVAIDKIIVKNDGVDSTTVTVTALDANNNVVSGAAVSVSVDAGGVFVPPPTNLTSATGVYMGTVKTGVDKTDRVITVTVTLNGVTKSVSFQVAGSKLSVTAIPQVAISGQAVTVTVSLKDANGIGIPSMPVTLSGATTKALVTDIAGNAAAALIAPTIAGIYTINAAGSGVLAQGQFQVGAAIASITLPVGIVPSLAITPNVLAANTTGSSLNQSALRVLFVDGSNQPIPNVRVRFEKAGTGIGYNGTVVSGTNTVYTDASGAASSVYISGTESSPTSGVVLRACYSGSDFITSTSCPAFVTASLTVSAQAVSISIGANNALEKDIGVYRQKFAVTVVDSAGRAVPNLPISFSLDTTHYGKGNFSSTVAYSLSSSAIGQAIPDLVTSPTTSVRVMCPNEDSNRNGVVDAGEDINGSVVLEPAAADISIASDTGKFLTDANGTLILKVTWQQKVATWAIFRIRVTTNVTGTQGLAERSFLTNYVKGDETIGSDFLIPPYGYGSCSENF
jgi:Invasin, domain 3